MKTKYLNMLFFWSIVIFNACLDKPLSVAVEHESPAIVSPKLKVKIPDTARDNSVQKVNLKSVDNLVEKVNTKENSTKSTIQTPTIEPAKLVKIKKNELESKIKTESKKAKDQTKEMSEEYDKMAKIQTSKLKTFSHEDFDNLLKIFVSESGKVNYIEFKKSEADLDNYLNYLSENHPDGWSRSKEMAYWINTYNAFTIKLILKNYPVSSITKLHDGKPWDVKWIKLGQNTYSLNQIENEILRPKFKDARIHFAVNCAAKSCPSIYNRAWTAANLESALESQTKKFINNNSFNKISISNAKLSKIFEWYAVDFGDLKVFINKYSNIKIDSNNTIKYLDYDWTLNE